MASYSSITTLVTPGGTITFNADTGDTYLIDPTLCSGLDMAPVRAVIDNAPRTKGGLVHDANQGPRMIVLAGMLLVRSASTEAAIVSAREALENDLTAALESILAADGTLTATPGDLTVRCDIEATYPGAFQKNFNFGLVAADPDWS